SDIEQDFISKTAWRETEVCELQWNKGPKASHKKSAIKSKGKLCPKQSHHKSRGTLHGNDGKRENESEK
ncbi:Hypothetical predicted protein, partial [Pelobates cultripes]